MFELSHQGVISSTETAVLLRYATRAAVATALLLMVVKFGAWLTTGATSLLATLIDSSLDMLASLTNLVAINYALRPADLEHRFGHGKLEPLAGLAQALFIGGSGIFLVSETVQRFLHPRPLVNTEIGIVVMIVSMIATLLLLRIQQRVVHLTASTAIHADSVHYATDLLTNGAVLGALLGNWLFHWDLLDPIFALGIAIYVLYSAGQIAWEAGQFLMDHELPEHERAIIIDIARQHPQVRGVSDLKSRRAGTTTFIQFQLEIDGNTILKEAHRVTNEVELQIKDKFPQAEIHIHQEPVT